jgi:hypothetical protein
MRPSFRCPVFLWVVLWLPPYSSKLEPAFKMDARQATVYAAFLVFLSALLLQ